MVKVNKPKFKVGDYIGTPGSELDRVIIKIKTYNLNEYMYLIKYTNNALFSEVSWHPEKIYEDYS